jgi:hypothetical protein
MRYSVSALFTLLLANSFPAVLMADEAGQPPLKLLQSGQTPGQTAATDTVPVPQNLHDIFGPVLLPDPVPYLLYGLIAFSMLVLLLAAYWWFYKRPKPAAPPIPPGILARDELMRARELMNPEQTLHYMERVSEILRRYLESRFQLRTTRQTTREFFQSLTARIHDNKAISGFSLELKSCLERCDLAKFAHQPSSVEHLQEMENSVLNFVNQTEQPAKTDTKGGDK